LSKNKKREAGNFSQLKNGYACTCTGKICESDVFLDSLIIILFLKKIKQKNKRPLKLGSLLKIKALLHSRETLAKL
jgi:hypothetical protein